MRKLVIERLMEQFKDQIEDDSDGLESALDMDLGLINLDEDDMTIEVIEAKLNECDDKLLLNIYDYFTGFQG